MWTCRRQSLALGAAHGRAGSGAGRAAGAATEVEALAYRCGLLQVRTRRSYRRVDVLRFLLYLRPPRTAAGHLGAQCVVAVCIHARRLIDHAAEMTNLGITYIVSFLLCQVFFWLSYFRCVFSDPGYVATGQPGQQPAPPSDASGGDEHGATKPVYCNTCCAVKPPRAHHCTLSHALYGWCRVSRSSVSVPIDHLSIETFLTVDHRPHMRPLHASHGSPRAFHTHHAC